jgi:hypothetical protein
VLRQSEWEGAVLVSRHHPTTAAGLVDTSDRPLVTRRWVEGDTMVQEASHDGYTFRRVYRRS